MFLLCDVEFLLFVAVVIFEFVLILTELYIVKFFFHII